MIKGIMVENVSREQILKLIDTPFGGLIKIMKGEDFENILTDNVLSKTQDKLKDGQDVELNFAIYHGIKPTKLKDVWRNKYDYNLRFELDFKKEIKNEEDDEHDSEIDE